MRISEFRADLAAIVAEAQNVISLAAIATNATLRPMVARYGLQRVQQAVMVAWERTPAAAVTAA